MNCHRFESNLDNLLVGRLSPSDQALAQKHLDECPRCRRLFLMVQGDNEIVGVENPERLTQAILERTSGSACKRAHELICQLVENELTRNEKLLLEMHFATCAPCRSLSQVLAELHITLPQMAEIEPGSAFTIIVLQATCHQPQPQVIRDKPVLAWWRRLLIRPRLAWEVAYICSVLLIALIQFSFLPWQKTAPATLAILQAKTHPAWESLSSLAVEGWNAGALTTGETKKTLLQSFSKGKKFLGVSSDYTVQNGEKVWMDTLHTAAQTKTEFLNKASAFLRSIQEKKTWPDEPRPPAVGS
jgi:predicted anti-sigma-YlaC factor YlaD